MSTQVSSRKKKLIENVMMAGRDAGTRAIMFHQAVAQVLGLNATDMRCLDVIFRSGPSSPSELAALTGLTTGAVTVLVDRLENAGLIVRKPDAEDRRKTLLVPTASAGERVGHYYHPMAKNMAKALSKYSEVELKLLERYFTESIEIWREETSQIQR